MDDNSPAKKKLIKYLLKRNPNLEETEIASQLNSIKRFVKVVQKIYTEPQAKIYFKEFEENEKKVKKRIIETTPDELSKLNRGTDKPITIETIRELTRKVTGIRGVKYGK